LAALDERGERHATVLLRAWRGLADESLDDHLLKQAELRRLQEDVYVSPTHASNGLLSALLVTLGEKFGQRSAAFLEDYLGKPVSNFAVAPCLSVDQARARLDVVRTWLQAVGPFHPEALATCEAVVREVRRVRSQYLRTNYGRRDGLEQAQTIWNDL